MDLRHSLDRARRWSKRKPRPRRPRPLTVEQLEERCTPTVLVAPHFGNESQLQDNGKRFNSPQVYVVLWGSSWGGTTTANAVAVNVGASQVISDDFLAGVAQYGVQTNASLAGFLWDNVADPQSGFSQKTMTDEIQNLINAKALPDPSKTPNMIVDMVTAQGKTSDINNAAGYNSAFVDSNKNPTYGFIWNGTSDGSLSLKDAYTLIFSHELAENMTEPGGQGYEVNPGTSWPGGLVSGQPQIGDYEGNSYTYRMPTGELVQPIWSKNDNAWLVTDANTQTAFLAAAANSWSGASFNGKYDLTIAGDQGGVRNDVITLDVQNGGRVFITENNEVFQFDAGSIHSITVNTGDGTDTVNVLRVPASVSQVNINNGGGGGSDVVNFGAGGSLAGILAPVNVFNGPSYTHVNIDDSADPFSRTVSIGAGGVSVSGLPAITFSNVSVNTLTFSGGGGNNTYTVTGSQAFGGTTLNTGAGADTVNVQATPYALAVNYQSATRSDMANLGQFSPFAGGYSVAGITGAVSLEDELGYVTVNVKDGADQAAHTATLDSVARAGDTTLGRLQGIGAGPITWDSYDTQAVNIDFGGGTSTVNVQATVVPTNLVDHGAATVNVGSGGSVAGIQGALSLENEASFDTVVINDASDGAARTATLDTVGGAGGTSLGRLLGLGAAPITWDYDDTAAVNVTFGTGTSTVNVLGTGAPTNLFNNATATVNVGSGGTVAGIAGPLSLDNEPSHDFVVINDQNDATARTATIDTFTPSGEGPFGRLQGLGNAPITWDYIDTSAATLNTGPGGAAVTDVNLVLLVTPLTLNGNPAGVNTLSAGDADTAWNVTGANAGTFSNSSARGSFTNFQNLHGGGGNDTFTFADGGSLSGTADGGGGTNTLVAAFFQNFDITGHNAGALFAPAGGAFANVQNLTGGNDIVFADGAGVDGNITGDSVAALDYLAYSTPVTVNLAAGTATGVGGAVSSITELRGGQGDDSLTGNAAGVTLFDASPGNDTVTGVGGTNHLGGTAADSTWNVTAQNGGTLTFAGGTTTFSGVQNLSGGAGADDFVFADGAGVDGNVGGGRGNNTLDESAYSTPVTVSLAGRTATGVGGAVVGVQNYVGSAAGGSTLVGPNTPTTWTVSGSDAGTVAGGNFSNFSNLTGGSGADTFVLSAGAALDGTLDGGGGANALVGPDADSVWNVTGVNAGAVSGGASVTFADIQSLSGGAGADHFVFADGAAIGGNLNGGLGANTLDESAYSTPVTVSLTANSATGVGGAFSNIQSFVGSAAGGSALTGPVLSTNWGLSGTDAGTVDGVSFSNFSYLTAGFGAARFIFADGAGVDGGIAGAGGFYTLDYSAYSTPVTVDLTAGTATGVGHFAGIQSFVGSAAGGNTLNGPAANTTWVLSGHNAGTLTGGLSFTAFQNLTGGAGDNTFFFQPGGLVDGTVTGGGGTNDLNYASYAGNVLVDLQTGAATGVGVVASIQNVEGNSAGAAGSFYNILVGNGGNVLTGGSDQRNLLIAGASASTLIGGSDNDILIGGTTDYDTNVAALLDIMSVWTSADTYANRVARLVDDPTYAFSLNAATVHSNGGGNTLTGKPDGSTALDLYFANPGAGDTTDAGPGDRFVGIA